MRRIIPQRGIPSARHTKTPTINIHSSPMNLELYRCLAFALVSSDFNRPHQQDISDCLRSRLGPPSRKYQSTPTFAPTTLCTPCLFFHSSYTLPRDPPNVVEQRLLQVHRLQNPTGVTDQPCRDASPVSLGKNPVIGSQSHSEKAVGYSNQQGGKTRAAKQKRSGGTAAAWQCSR